MMFVMLSVAMASILDPEDCPIYSHYRGSGGAPQRLLDRYNAELAERDRINLGMQDLTMQITIRYTWVKYLDHMAYEVPSSADTQTGI